MSGGTIMLLMWHMWWQAWNRTDSGYHMLYPSLPTVPDVNQEQQFPTSAPRFPSP